MGMFRKADVAKVIRYETPDGEDWIDLRAELTKREVNSLLLKAPRPKYDEHKNQIPDIEAGLAFVDEFFKVGLTAWSLQDEAGNPVAPTIETYRELTSEAANWIQERLTEHLNKIIGGKDVQDAEKKPLN